MRGAPGYSTVTMYYVIAAMKGETLHRDHIGRGVQGGSRAHWHTWKVRQGKCSAFTEEEAGTRLQIKRPGIGKLLQEENLR